MRNDEVNEVDWDAIETLYVVGGLTPRQITLAPEYSNLKEGLIKRRIENEGWFGKRTKFLESKLAVISHNVAEQMRKAADSARSTIAREVEEELRIYQTRPKGMTENDQKNRLDLLTRIVNICDKVFPMEQFALPDTNKAGYHSLTQYNIGTVNVQSPKSKNESPTNALDTLPAVLPLLSSQNETTGILEELGGGTKGHIDFTIQAPAGEMGIEAPETQEASIQTEITDAEALSLAKEMESYGKEKDKERQASEHKKNGGWGFSSGGDKEESTPEPEKKKARKKSQED